LARGGHLGEVIFKDRLEVTVETDGDITLIPGRVTLGARFWRALSYNNAINFKGFRRYVLAQESKALDALDDLTGIWIRLHCPDHYVKTLLVSKVDIVVRGVKGMPAARDLLDPVGGKRLARRRETDNDNNLATLQKIVLLLVNNA